MFMSNGLIDLRSDTVTEPSEEMRRAMYAAEVGDDTYSGDPTVLRLQELAAAMTGKEAALFVVSGTMGNLLGALVNTTPGQEVILGDLAHQFLWEVGGIARVAGLVTHTVPFHNGFLDPSDVEAAIRPASSREAASTGLICVEDTSNIGGGAVIPPAHLAQVAAVARRHNLPIHMDGARFWNAVVAAGEPAPAFTQHVDTLSFCLSKGLSCPFGAMLCGSKAAIERALTFRQMLGGGMRQAGVMAAAGLVALQTGIERLADDHANAKKLALGLADRFPGCVDPSAIQTNLVHIRIASLPVRNQELLAFLKERGISIFPGGERVRLTTHRQVTAADIDRVLATFDLLKQA